MNLVGGVVAVNALFLVAGYAALVRPLRGTGWIERASWAGLALLLGAGAVGTLVFLATMLGFHASVWLAVGAAFLIGVLGALQPFLPPRQSALVSTPAAACFGVVAAICVLGIVGGFRSAPWLDDAWGIWLPKGIALWWHGLDERLFVPNGDYVAFGVPDYPLWWSVVTSLDMQATRDVSQIENSRFNIDVRVMCAQLGLLTAAFVASVARLLSGYVRTGVLAGGLLLLTLSPELWRHVQGGVADLPLAIYLALGVLAGALWLRTRAPFHLALAVVCAAIALQIKTEALLEVVVLVLVGALFDRRLVLAGAALVTALPWIVWRWVHDVPSRAGDLDLSRLGRIPNAVAEVAEHLLNPTEWLVIVPAFLVLAILARRPAALLVPAALVAVVVAAYWIDRDEITFVLETSAYRVVDPVVLAAAVLLPLLAETFLQQRQALRKDHVLIGEP